MSSHLRSIPSMSIDIFKENMYKNIAFVEEHIDSLEDAGDRQFAKQLINFHDTKDYLTSGQLSYMIRYWSELAEKFNPPS